MIRVNELRIGNSVNCCNTKTVLDAELFLKLLRYTTPFEPIPLTDEWLFKFGFEKTLNQYRKPTLLNKIGYNNIPFILLFLDNQYQYDDLRFRTNIKYVNQLQNLYFALTGEELTIKDLKYNQNESK